MREGNAEIGELVVDMASEPIKDVGALGEDGGGVRVRVPGGGESAVGKIAAEEGDCSPEGASARVSCFEENVMENVGDVECLYGSVAHEKRQVRSVHRSSCGAV